MSDKRQNTVSAPKRESKAIKYLAGLFLIVTVIIIGFGLYRNTISSSASAEETSNTERSVPVVTAFPIVLDFEQLIVVHGNIEAKESALVTPRIPGVIETIFVDEGESVTGGQTRLFQIDKLKLEKALDIRRYEMAVASCTVQEKIANLERMEADFEKARLDYQRFQRLIEKSAVTPDAFEQQESRYKQSQAMLKHSKAQLDLSTERLRQAEAALAIAEKDLADAIVTAPINGKISYKFQEPGEMGSPGKPVVRIDDTSVVEVSAYLPSQYYNDVNLSDTKVDIGVSGIDVNDLVISYKSPTINPKLRTFEIKCIIENPPEGVVPGAIARIKVVLLSRSGLAVPSSAIQRRGDSDVVFVTRDDICHEMVVTTGLQNDGLTEILESELTEEMPVVIMGQTLVEEGTQVSAKQEQD